MKVPSRKTVSVSEQRRYDLQADRAQASTVRESFPEVCLIEIDLNFAETPTPIPSPQRHSLYPPARAFFRFACPCADCDGEFDLGTAVLELVKVASSKNRTSSRSISAQRRCQGTRWRDSNHSEACCVALTFQVIVGISPVVELPDKPTI